MKIFAKSVNGELIELDATKTDRVIDVKNKIEFITGLSSYEQRLIYQARILDDDKTLHFYRISEKSTIHVIDRFRCGMQIVIKTMHGKSTELEITKNEIIMEVKQKIQKKVGISTDEMILMYQGEILDNNETVEYYRITEKNIIIVLIRESFQIYAKMISGDSIPIQVSKSHRIVDIKKMIQERIKLSVFEQILSYKNIVLNNKMTIGDYQINCNSIINVSERDSESKKQGICLIICNEIFLKNQPILLGTKEDEKRISETFERLGFKIKVYRDVAWDNVNQLITRTKEDLQERDSMLVSFVLSRGDCQSFLTSDCRRFPYSNLWSSFTNNDCPKFSGKPKLFFFVSYPMKCDENGPQECSGDAKESAPLSQNMADLFLGHSVDDSYEYYCDKDSGSSYVSLLCQVINKRPDWSVCDIHQEVQRLLSLKSFTNDGLQAPYCINHLTKNAHFIHDRL